MKIEDADRQRQYADRQRQRAGRTVKAVASVWKVENEMAAEGLEAKMESRGSKIEDADRQRQYADRSISTVSVSMEN